MTTLHLVGIFHTVHNSDYSHCAFTGKALRFAKMMKPYGYTVLEYSNEGSQSEADEHIVILNKDEFDSLFGGRGDKDFHGDNATIGSPGHAKFQNKLIAEMRKRVKPQDIICHPFGHAHEPLLAEFPECIHVETGIGYPTLMSGSKRIFESYAWMHYHQGKEGRNGTNYEWVVPNYFDLEEWEYCEEPDDYFAFMGRICSIKGLDTILEIARRRDIKIKIAGQGDPTPWTHPNIEYVGPLKGKERSDFIRKARASFMPTVFTEPFGGSGVEGMLCGTPLIAVDYGAFTETVIQGTTGYRCHTLQDWLDAVDNIDLIDRWTTSQVARARYSLEVCGERYDKIFQDLSNLYRKGWYQLRDDESEPKEINFDQIESEEKAPSETIARWIADIVQPEKVLDIGCGPGTYVNSLRNLGVEAWGYDIDDRVEGKPFLTKRSLFDVKDCGDLVMCFEVAEHIDGELNYEIVESIVDLLGFKGILMWSAAQPGQGGTGHINCQPKEFWQKEFQEAGLIHDPVLERSLKNYIQDKPHMGWFMNNVLIFRALD